jgi:hypothetical protein
MVSSKAKTVSIVFRAELTVGGRACDMSFAKTRTRPRALGQGLGNPLLLDVAVTTERVRPEKRAAAGSGSSITLVASVTSRSGSCI